MPKIKKLEEVKHKSIEPLAMRLGYDYAEEYSGDNLRPAQKALELLSCGFDMYVQFMSTDAFPSLDRRIRKRGTKLIYRNLLYSSAQCASALTQGIPTLILEMHDSAPAPPQDEQDPLRSREHYLKLRSLIGDYFPLDKKDKEMFEECSAEFEVMRTQSPRDAVAEGEALANAYSRALLEGENPDKDPELVKEQRQFARDYFVNKLSFGLVKVGLLARKRRITTYNRVSAGMLDIGKRDGPDVREHRARMLAALLEVMRPYQKKAPLDAQFLREIGLDSAEAD